MQEEKSNQGNLKGILADLYKKLDVLAKELDIMAQDPKERRTRRYNKLIDSYDKLSKRAIELSVILGGDRQSEEENRKMNDLIALLDWTRSHGEKTPLMTFKHYPVAHKRTLDVEKDASESLRHELERMLEMRMRDIFGESFEDLQNTRKRDSSAA